VSLASPLVSIIMPTYNRPVFLRQALASVFAQTLDGWELIVADDGSGADADGRPMPAARQLAPPRAGWILDDLVGGGTSVAQSSVPVEQALLTHVGGYDPTVPLCGDLELLARLAAQSEVDVIDEPLTRVRGHSEHVADDLTALTDLDRALTRMRRTAPRLAGLIRARRRGVAAGMAHGHARLRQAGRALAILRASACYSWPHRPWWTGAARAALALTPQRVQPAVRARRRRLLARRPSQARCP
jgi:hypothetical protein